MARAMSSKITPENAETFIGKTFTVFGYTYTVTDITPEADWFWRVNARTVDPDLSSRFVELVLPSHVLTN